MKRFLSFYHPKFPIYLIQLLRQAEYNPNTFAKRLLSFPDLTTFKGRKRAVHTTKSKLLLAGTYLIFLWYIFIGMVLMIKFTIAGILLLVLAPFMTSFILYVAVLPLWIWLNQH